MRDTDPLRVQQDALQRCVSYSTYNILLNKSSFLIYDNISASNAQQTGDILNMSMLGFQ